MGVVGRHRVAALAIGAPAVVIVAIAILLIVARWPSALSHEASCGNVVNGSNYNPQPAQCLWNAYQARQAGQAVMVNLTVEGDPISYAVDVLGTAVRVSITSQDRFGPRGSFIYVCSGLTQKMATNGSGHLYLVATGCQGPQGFVDDSGRVTIP